MNRNMIKISTVFKAGLPLKQMPRVWKFILDEMKFSSTEKKTKEDKNLRAFIELDDSFPGPEWGSTAVAWSLIGERERDPTGRDSLPHLPASFFLRGTGAGPWSSHRRGLWGHVRAVEYFSVTASLGAGEESTGRNKKEREQKIKTHN